MAAPENDVKHVAHLELGPNEERQSSALSGGNEKWREPDVGQVKPTARTGRRFNRKHDDKIRGPRPCKDTLRGAPRQVKVRFIVTKSVE